MPGFYELKIGLTYTRKGRKGRRRDGFMSFISVISVLSIAIGVAALIIVLSVMNGFQKEVRDRMLSVVPHAEVYSYVPMTAEGWKPLEEKLRAMESVKGAAPFIEGQALFNTGRAVQGALVKGIDPDKENEASGINSIVLPDSSVLEKLEPGSFNVVMGTHLASKLGVGIGGKVALMVPQGTSTPAGVLPRVKQLTLVGLMNSGHYEYDSSMAFVNIEDGEKLYRLKGPQGVRLKLEDLEKAPETAVEIGRELGPDYFVRDWSKVNRTWFAAVQVEKRMMGIILFLIVVVGAFGLVSTMVMTVKEKEGDIAILRTIGATPASILAIFLVQGTIVGAVGVAAGVGLGLLISFNVGEIVSFIESLAGVQFLPQEIYFISSMPSDPRAGDIIPIAVFSFLMSVAATLYPSWRASRIKPAEALRYE